MREPGFEHRPSGPTLVLSIALMAPPSTAPITSQMSPLLPSLWGPRARSGGLLGQLDPGRPLFPGSPPSYATHRRLASHRRDRPPGSPGRMLPSGVQVPQLLEVGGLDLKLPPRTGPSGKHRKSVPCGAGGSGSHQPTTPWGLRAHPPLSDARAPTSSPRPRWQEPQPPGQEARLHRAWLVASERGSGGGRPEERRPAQSPRRPCAHTPNPQCRLAP